VNLEIGSVLAISHGPDNGGGELIPQSGLLNQSLPAPENCQSLFCIHQVNRTTTLNASRKTRGDINNVVFILPLCWTSDFKLCSIPTSNCSVEYLAHRLQIKVFIFPLRRSCDSKLLALSSNLSSHQLFAVLTLGECLIRSISDFSALVGDADW